MGIAVCLWSFLALWGIGHGRCWRNRTAVLQGASVPPSHLRSWVASYLEELYQSEAETLPDATDDVDAGWFHDRLREQDGYAEPLRP